MPDYYPARFYQKGPVSLPTWGEVRAYANLWMSAYSHGWATMPLSTAYHSYMFLILARLDAVEHANDAHVIP